MVKISKQNSREPGKVRALKFQRTGDGEKYLFFICEKDLIISSPGEITWEKREDQNIIFALLMHEFPHSLQNLHSTKEKNHVTGNATISWIHIIMVECDHDVLGNEEIIANVKSFYEMDAGALRKRAESRYMNRKQFHLSSKPTQSTWDHVKGL